MNDRLDGPDNNYAWLTEDALTIAPRLIGWELVSHSPVGETGGRIIEVEAYHGAEDPASHAFRGQTARNAPMFAAGSTIYLYRSYGIHTCLNIVTGPAGEAQAVLIRALEPTIGLDLMAQRRGLANPRLLTSGPGRLGQALGLILAMNGTRLGSNGLELRPPSTPVNTAAIIATPRIGIRVAVDRPWRFCLKDLGR